MRIHKEETIARLKEFRLAGYSIPALMQEFKLPKTTIWHHVHTLKVPENYTKKIRSGQGGSKQRSEKAWEKSQENAEEILKDPQKSYWASVLAMLYWAEGNKKEFTFTNTDPTMIGLVVNILNKVFGIRSADLVITVRYFTGMKEKACRDYWGKATGADRANFRMYLNDGGSVGRTPFGICRLRIKKSGNIFKVIQSLIKKISNNMPLSFNG